MLEDIIVHLLSSLFMSWGFNALMGKLLDLSKSCHLHPSNHICCRLADLISTLKTKTNLHFQLEIFSSNDLQTGCNEKLISAYKDTI